MRFNIHCFRTRVMATGWENRCDNGRHLKKKFKKVGRGDISEVEQSDVCPTERGPKKIRRVRKKVEEWGLYPADAQQQQVKGLSCRGRDDRWVFRGLLELSGLLQGGDLGLGLEISGSARSSFWPSPGEPRPTAQVRSLTVPAISVLAIKLPPTSPIPTPIHRH